MADTINKTGWGDVVGKLIDGATTVLSKKYENPWGMGGTLGAGIPMPGNVNATTGYGAEAGAVGNFAIDRETLMLGAALLAVLGVALVVAR